LREHKIRDLTGMNQSFLKDVSYRGDDEQCGVLLRRQEDILGSIPTYKQNQGGGNKKKL